MFLRSYKRKKNGKWHEYFSVVENRRVAKGKTLQIFDQDTGKTLTKSLFAE